MDVKYIKEIRENIEDFFSDLSGIHTMVELKKAIANHYIGILNKYKDYDDFDIVQTTKLMNDKYHIEILWINKEGESFSKWRQNND